MSLNLASSIVRNSTTNSTTNTPSINNHVSVHVRSTKDRTKKDDDDKLELDDIPTSLPEQKRDFPEPISEFPAAQPPPLQPYPAINYVMPYQNKIPEFEHTLLGFYRELLGKNKALLAALIEPSSRAIFTIEQLAILISILTSTNDVAIETSPITKCCGVHKILENIDRILVNGTDFKIEFNEIYNYMMNSGVSLIHITHME